MEGMILNPFFLFFCLFFIMFYCRFANSKWDLLCKSNWYKLLNMKNDPKTTHIPYKVKKENKIQHSYQGTGVNMSPLA